MNGSGSPGVQKTVLDSCLGSKVSQIMKRRSITGPSYTIAGIYEQDSSILVFMSKTWHITEILAH